MEQVLYELPMGWEWHKLAEVVDLVTKGTTPTSVGFKFESSGINFVKIENIKSGKIDPTSFNSFISAEANKALKRSMLYEGDILFSIAGTIGTVALVSSDVLPANTNQALAIIRGYEEYLIDRYLMHVLRSSISSTLNNKKRGGALQNISLKDIKETAIPIPSLAEQKRIVEKLDALLTRIDTAIKHLQESVTLADALYASELACVFSSGQGKWPLRELNGVAEVARGKSKHRPRNDKSLFGGEHPFIQTGDVRNAQKYITNYSATYNEKGLQQSKLWPKDTICLTIAANIGDVAILGMDACFPDSVVGISSSELETDYLYYFLTTLQQQLDSKANAAAQKNINLKILSEIKIPVPTLDEQKSIVRQINEIDRLAVKAKAEMSEKITMMQQLKASILDSAFKGEL
ncbi:restriction endonuclease subunit S [Providencia sp. PROV121]|uniref:restriction endonuclease subunit S n=1 Tax=Providencia sp. PROV121 TaxID=2949832 RepID=UPI00234A1747|nr:restriction endonuclease subunit S [Providencia sp. PROV121]